MRRLALACFLLGCAHASRSHDPEAWVEVQTEHLLLRTDLPPQEARKAASDLELVRASLLATGWHSARQVPGRTLVVELADDRELREFAVKGLDGFVASDAFEEPIMVVSGSQDAEEQQLFKHEMAHVISHGFLVSKPRWLDEGIACYLETLRLDRRRQKVLVGKLSDHRVLFLRDFPVFDFSTVLHTGREAEMMDAQAGYAFESAAWLIVHWLVDTRPRRFDAFLQRLANAEPAEQAFQAEFPDLTEGAIRAGIKEYWTKGAALIGEVPAPRWDGEIALRKMDPAEVHSLLADLLRLSPGYSKTPERAARIKAELALAFAADPGDPRALKLTPEADPAPAISAHPDDWRTWMLVADRKPGDREAIERAARISPDNAIVLERLAAAELNGGDTDRALSHARHAAELAPGRSDVLDMLAQVYAATDRCVEAEITEQRAIDALPDAAPGSALGQLRKRMEWIGRHCGEMIERRVLVQPVLRGCGAAVPVARAKDRPRGAIGAEFTIREDGSVDDVTVKGDASRAFLAVMKKYFESCRYEPIVHEGKPLSVKSSASVRFQ